MMGCVLPLQPGFQAFRSKQLLGLETHFERETEGALAGERRMPGLLQHQPRHGDRILDAVQVADAAGAMPRAVHDGGIQLHHPFGVGQTSVTHGRNLWIVFRHVDSLFHGVQQAAASVKDFGGALVRGLAMGPGRQKHGSTLRRI